ncbi:MAG TPA: preprotein translocase subunit SecG [Steroidobacteraceae bacterium]|nr:preprotein translocase subunit SecG [Steroidobacteraceae bacterium]
MNWLQTLTIVLHVLIAAAIVGLVLLQRGKGADAGAGFGSGASGTVFGARGSASFLSRTTAILAALFMVTSLTLAYMGGRKSAAPTSVIDRVQEPASPDTTLPAVPSGTANQSVESSAAPAQNQAPQNPAPQK